MRCGKQFYTAPMGLQNRVRIFRSCDLIKSDIFRPHTTQCHQYPLFL